MKKVITMIMLMLVMSMMIPVCAYAQTYEETEENSKVIEELIDIGFGFDKDTGLWIIDTAETYDWDEKDVVSASYNLITNSGTMVYQEYEKEEEDYNLVVTYNIDFKWYVDEEEFGIVKCVIDANKFMNDITF